MPTAMQSSAVYSCVSVISQEIAKTPLKHWRRLPNGGREEVRDSRIARILRRPNPVETRAEWMLNYTASILLQGNAYGIAERDSMGRITSIWRRPPDTVTPQVDVESGAVFYEVPANNFKPSDVRKVPARDVIHTKAFATSDPLRGVSPLTACAYSLANGGQIQRQSVAFWSNHARPSGILSTNGQLSAEAQRRLRDQWRQANSGDKAGSVAVLDSGLKWSPLAMSATDSQLVAQFNLSVEDIARCYRVPPAWVGLMTSTTFSNIESLRRSFYQSCISFWMELIEAQFSKLFGLGADQEIEFAIEESLARSEWPNRAAALKDAIQGGIMTPNEARSREGLPPVPAGGDEIYLQAQMEPVGDRPEPEAIPEPERIAPPEDDDLVRSLVDSAKERMMLSAELGTARAKIAELEALSDG